MTVKKATSARKTAGIKKIAEPTAPVDVRSDTTIYPNWVGELPTHARAIPYYFAPAMDDPDVRKVSIRYPIKVWKDIELVKEKTGRSQQMLMIEALDMLFLKYLGRMTRKV